MGSIHDPCKGLDWKGQKDIWQICSIKLLHVMVYKGARSGAIGRSRSNSYSKKLLTLKSLIVKKEQSAILCGQKLNYIILLLEFI